MQKEYYTYAECLCARDIWKLVKNLTYSVNQSATPKQQEREAKKYAMDMEDKLKYGYDYNAEKMSFEDFAYKWLRLFFILS